MNPLLILSILSLIISKSTEYLPLSMSLDYELYQDSSGSNRVKFTWQVPLDLHNKYTWKAIGFKSSLDPIESNFADFFVVLQDNSMHDMFTKTQNIPIKDSENGCESNLNTEFEENEFFAIFSWNRDLNTGDKSCDIVLRPDWPYCIFYLLGFQNADGELGQAEEYGFEYLLLKDLYFDINDDERGKYGPWNLNY